MIMDSSTGRLARWCARHAWLVLGIWLAVLVAGGVLAFGLGDALTAGDMEMTNNPESVQGQTLLDQRLREPEPVTETVIVRSTTLTVEDAAFQTKVDSVTQELTSLIGVVASAVNYYQAAQGSPQAAEAMVSSDRKATLVSVTMVGTSDQVDKNIASYLASVEKLDTGGFQVVSVGSSSIGNEFAATAARDLRTTELVGLPLTMVVLVLVFGALAAAGVSLLLAGAAIVTSLGMTAVVGHFFPLSFFIVNMVTMLGLAVGIDYALFIVARYREERRRGMDKIDAISVAGATASKAVLFSGVTVMLALLGLLIVPITTFRSLGAGAVLVVSAAVAAMLTLVPAVLSLLGDRINWPRLRLHRKRPEKQEIIWEGHSGETVYKGFVGRLTRLVMARPVVSVVVVVLILVAMAVPFAGLQKGNAGGESLPPGDVKDGYQILVRDFSVGNLAPVEIVVDGKRDANIDAALAALSATLRQDPSYLPATQVTWNDADDLAVLSVSLVTGSRTPSSYAAVEQLRTKTIPDVFSATGAKVYVTGSTASNADTLQLIDTYTPWVFMFVLGLSFILLLMVFRSVVVPLKAILMNLLSVLAAYGVLVLVFQKGWGHELFGFQQTPTIEAWVPLFLFCILFGLSMDYHVFLLSRIREYFDETGENLTSVAVGLRSTGRLITGAAAIMVVVFSTFAAGNLVHMQQMGFGLAVAVFLDATLVRSILVPSAMALLGKVNWYLPRWLSWLPDLRMEGKVGIDRPTPTSGRAARHKRAGSVRKELPSRP
jgi:putative drug exporter of the RND superfamily